MRINIRHILLISIFVFITIISFGQKSNFVVIPKEIVNIYNNQPISKIDIFKCDTTKGGRWVYSTNLLYYYPQIVNRIMDSLQIATIDTEYLPIDSFIRQTYTIGK